ncbi:MAG: Rieske (2Fe-2S) protein [Planctomycetaceae bacterium]
MSEEHAEPEFTTVAKVGDIPTGEGRAFPVKGTMVAVFFVDGEYSAINDFCPHMGASLAEGHVEDGAVLCPWHAWSFSIKDGSWLDAKDSPVRCAAYRVRVEDGAIQVAVTVPETDTDAPECDSSS